MTAQVESAPRIRLDGSLAPRAKTHSVMRERIYREPK
jgi:hypothetical protein